MNETSLVWAVFIIYLIVIFSIGFWSYKRSKTVIEFFLAGRRLGYWILSFSFFATYFSTAAFLGGGGSGFTFGFQWSAWLSFWHVLFAFLAWIIVAPKIRELSEKLKSLTIPDFLGFRYKSNAPRLIAAIIILFSFELYMTSIYKGIGHIFEEMLHVKYLIGILIAVIPVIIYTSLGGFRSVVLTDLIQGVIMFFGGIVLFLLVLNAVGGWSAGIEKLKEVEPLGMSGELLLETPGLAPPPIMKAGMVLAFIMSLTFAISIAQLASPQLVIRFYAARNREIIRRGAILTPVIIGIFALTVFSIGPFAWLILPDYVDSADQIKMFFKNPDRIIPFIAMKLFPTGINAFILTAIIAAAMSTINSLLLILATSLTRDIIQVVKSEISEEKLLLTTRIATVLFAAIPIYLAVLMLEKGRIIVEIVGTAFSIITSAFLAPLVIGLYWNRGSAFGASVSMILSTITCIIWYLKFYKVYWIYPVVPGLIVGITSYIIFSLLKPDKK